jgi:hypothetical protein
MLPPIIERRSTPPPNTWSALRIVNAPPVS